MSKQNHRNSEKVVLPVSLRSRKTIDNQDVVSEAQTENDESHIESLEAALRQILHERFGTLHQKRLDQKEILRLRAEMEGLKQLHNILDDTLSSSTKQIVELKECLKIADNDHITTITNLKAHEFELKEKQSALDDLTSVQKFKTQQLEELQEQNLELSVQLKEKKLENQLLKEKVSEQEIQIKLLSEEKGKAKRTIELFKCRLRMVQDTQAFGHTSVDSRAPIIGFGCDFYSSRKDHHLLEQIEMSLEDLRADNRRLIQRNQDLVEAYWPLMSKIQSMKQYMEH